MASTVYVSIGSNSGDRYAFIERAAAALSLLCTRLEVSRPYVSAPWGFESAGEFVNVAAAMHFDARTEPWSVDEAHALLHRLQQIERSISSMPHRNADGTYRDREIDIDIIEIDDQRFATPQLTVPHPLAAQRAFVMLPLRELKGVI